MKKNHILLFITFLLVNACSGGGSVSVLPSSDEYDQYSELNPKMDILWVVDNSNSMQQEINNVINNINKFVEVYIEQDYDFRMGVISSSAWALESYKEFKDYQDCMAGPGVGCVAPAGGDRSYLLHPADGKSVFGRFHTGECVDDNSGYPFIRDNTPNITDVFRLNFNVYGLHSIGNCGTNTDYNATYHPNATQYIPFIHDYYHNVSPNPASSTSAPGSTPATSPLFGRAERQKLFAYVGDERPLQSMRAFLNPEISPELSSFLRPDAFLAVILITDEEDHSRPSLQAVNGTAGSGSVQTDYIDFLEDLKGGPELFKVYVISHPGFARVNSAATLSGGLTLEINKSDDNDPHPAETGKTKGEVRYLDMLTQITSNIVEASTIFALNCEPNMSSGIEVKFFEPPYASGFIVPKASDNGGQGWNYSSTGSSDPGVITFTEDFYPQGGTKIYINYTAIDLGCNP